MDDDEETDDGDDEGDAGDEEGVYELIGGGGDHEEVDGASELDAEWQCCAC